MKRSTAYLIGLAAVVVLAAYLVVMLGMVSRKRQEMRCTGLNVTVTDSSRHSFVTARDIAACISEEYGSCTDKSVAEIDLDRIEKIIKGRNAVLSAEAYISSDGRLNVRVVQRTPVLRFKGPDTDFFTDAEGYVFHLHGNAASKVTTVTGSIPVRVDEGFRGELADSASEAWIRDMITLSGYVRRAGLWDDVSIAVRDNGDVALRPASGRPLFILGRPDNFKSKFSRIGRYYTAVVPAVGEDAYSTVSVKFAGQIVCRK